MFCEHHARGGQGGASGVMRRKEWAAIEKVHSIHALRADATDKLGSSCTSMFHCPSSSNPSCKKYGRKAHRSHHCRAVATPSARLDSPLIAPFPLDRMCWLPVTTQDAPQTYLAAAPEGTSSRALRRPPRNSPGTCIDEAARVFP